MRGGRATVCGSSARPWRSSSGGDFRTPRPDLGHREEGHDADNNATRAWQRRSRSPPNQDEFGPEAAAHRERGDHGCPHGDQRRGR